MRVLFVHRAFPAQFGRLALELSARYGWDCRFVVGHQSRCPTPTREMLARLPVFQLPPAPASGVTPWPEAFGAFLGVAGQVSRAVEANPEFRDADLVVGHLGLGPTLFLPDLVRCPILVYAEYYFAPRFADLTYRVDLPPAEPVPFYPRCINAPQLVELTSADAAYSATGFQRDSFPPRFRPKIAVRFDGVDTTEYCPGRATRADAPRLLNGRSLPPGTKLVTYAARGLESMRGFDIFLEVAARITRERPDVLFAVAGGDESYYGWDRLSTGRPTFREWATERMRNAERGTRNENPESGSRLDSAFRVPHSALERFVFLGQIDPDHLADVLSLSDLHIYLTVPFVPSWSLFDALASGCVVLASDVAPVREVIEPGVTGRVEPLFDVDGLAAAAMRVLADPAGYAPLGAAARRMIEERYSLDVCVPALKGLYEGAANGSGVL